MKHSIFAISLISAIAAAPAVFAADWGGSTKDSYTATQEAPRYNWSGAFFGGSLGGTNMSSEVNQDLPSFSLFGVSEGTVLGLANADRRIAGDASDEGLAGGLEMGMQKQFNRFVIGGNIELMGFDTTSRGRCWKAGRGFNTTGGPADDFSFNANTQCETSVNWAANASLKAGYAIRNWLPYVTVGYAVAGADYKQVFSYSDRVGTDGASTFRNSARITQGSSETLHGVSWGGGVDYAVSNNLIIGADYKRLDLEGSGAGFAGTSDRDIEMNIFRVTGKIKLN